MPDKKTKQQPTAEEIAAQPSRLELRLAPVEVLIGGARWKIMAQSAAVLQYVQTRYKGPQAEGADQDEPAWAWRLAQFALQACPDLLLDGEPYQLVFEEVTIRNRKHRRVSNDQWDEFWDVLPTHITRGLVDEVLDQSLISAAEKKSWNYISHLAQQASPATATPQSETTE